MMRIRITSADSFLRSGFRNMMFPVNRKASDLTAVELLNLYDQARRADLNTLSGDEFTEAQQCVGQLGQGLSLFGGYQGNR